MVRFGTYTSYNGEFFRLVDNKTSFVLVFEGADCPLTGFTKRADKIYYKQVNREEITNAFFVITKCSYKQFVFDLVGLKTGGYSIISDNTEIQEKFNMRFVDRGVYEMDIELQDLEKVWEIRKSSAYNLPMPMGLEEYAEISIADI